MYEENMIWVEIVIAIFSLLVSLIIATYVHYHNERKKQKIALLSELMANRHGLTGNETNSEAGERFVYELNKVFAVFYNSKEITSILMNFHLDKENARENVTNLLVAICKDLRIDITTVPASFFETPFTLNREKS